MGFASASLTFSLSSALSLKCLMMRLLISILAVACLMNANINPEKVLSHREHRVHRENHQPAPSLRGGAADAAIQPSQHPAQPTKPSGLPRPAAPPGRQPPPTSTPPSPL